jgi:hypothetical protein
LQIKVTRFAKITSFSFHISLYTHKVTGNIWNNLGFQRQYLALTWCAAASIDNSGHIARTWFTIRVSPESFGTFFASRTSVALFTDTLPGLKALRDKRRVFYAMADGSDGAATARQTRLASVGSNARRSIITVNTLFAIDASSEILQVQQK